MNAPGDGKAAQFDLGLYVEQTINSMLQQERPVPKLYWSSLWHFLQSNVYQKLLSIIKKSYKNLEDHKAADEEPEA